MIVAVTGGNGFIGSILTSRLKFEGHEVRILSRKPSGEDGYFLGDLTDENVKLDEFLQNVDVLYHCAGEVNDPKRMYDLHVEGTKRLVKAAERKIKNWVQLSSVGAYGKLRSGNVTENTMPGPAGPYETTKTLSDEIVLQAANNNAFHLTILRPSTVYGPSMTNQSFFSLISAINNGLFFYIGKQGAVANYIHVNNVVEALILCGTDLSVKPRIFNLSDDCNMEDLVGEISECLGRMPPTLRLPEKFIRVCAYLGSFAGVNILTANRIDALSNRVIYESDRIRKDLSYREIITMKSGIKEMVQRWQLMKCNPS